MKPGEGIHVVKVMVWNHDNFGAFKSKEISNAFSSLVLFLYKDIQIYQFDFKVQKMKSSCPLSMKLTRPHFIPSSPRSPSFFSYLTLFPSDHGQPNTFIIFCSTNKAVHWSEVLTPHNDPLSESHCSYTQDNYSTLQLERGNYWERCSSRIRRGEKRGLGHGSCGCIVYWGRWSNKRPQLSQDAGRKTWCGDMNAEKRLGGASSMFYSLSKTSDSAATAHGIFLCFCNSLSHFLSSVLSSHSSYTAD